MHRSFKAGLALAALLTPISLLAATADVKIPKSNESKVQSDITKANKTLSDMQKLGQQIQQRQTALAAGGSGASGATVRTAAETTPETTTVKKTTKKAANGKAKTTKKKKNP